MLRTEEPDAPKPAPPIMGYACPADVDAPPPFKPWELHGETELAYWKRNYLQQAVIIGLVPLESLRLASERMARFTGKHGAFDPKPVDARLDSIDRHSHQARLNIATAEEPDRTAHLAAIAVQALCALEKIRRDALAVNLDYPKSGDPTNR
jgi:hypothetical protein